MLHPRFPTLSLPVLHYSLLSVALSCVVLALLTSFRTTLRFMYSCFVKPLIQSSQSSEQKDQLEEFYAGQADVYDSTRTHLLKGRETMLQLLAAHLKAQPSSAIPADTARPKIWVDIGGGTGWNIEKM